MTPIQQAIAILEEDALTNRIERALEVLRGVPQRPQEHGCWSDEDYNRARDCMIGILRGHAWTIRDGRMSDEFDNAFQHAVGLLALTVSRPDRNTGEA
jgi:hypothetical protein